ncbi:MAG: hypothetical protein IKG79_07255 [Neisseriaceae bacterium]|nr:hypothetical protein [Neisseriaceae bacterium]
MKNQIIKKYLKEELLSLGTLLLIFIIFPLILGIDFTVFNFNLFYLGFGILFLLFHLVFSFIGFLQLLLVKEPNKNMFYNNTTGFAVAACGVVMIFVLLSWNILSVFFRRMFF